MFLARPPGPRIAMLIFSLAPFTLPTAGWGKAPAAIIAPVAAPAVSMKPRRLTLLLSLIGLDSRNLEAKPRPTRVNLGRRAFALTRPGPSRRSADGLVDLNARI